MIIAALSIFPVGEGTSLSKYVKASLEELKHSGLTIQIGAMATTIEASTLDDLFQAIKKAHDIQITMGAQRVYFVLTVDNRQDRNATMSTKLKSIGEE
ncbi:MAG: MTH1187 family thiamine-binding protein [Candidatus Bathyarchaeota archaeon]|nr:MTH1187 family thiamine-binding protein [Candidatus Bathyarchaeota archaeon]